MIKVVQVTTVGGAIRDFHCEIGGLGSLNVSTSEGMLIIQESNGQVGDRRTLFAAGTWATCFQYTIEGD